MSQTDRPAPEPQRVVITSIDIPFGEMVQLLIGLAIAAIPAVILLAILSFIVTTVFGIGMAGLHRF